MFSVLLADDEPAIIEGLKTKADWNSIGFEICDTAANGIECIEKLKSKQPDLLITDIRMPGWSGIDITEIIRTQNYSTEVILLSGYSEFEYAKKGIDLETIGYILKPVDRNELKVILQKAYQKIAEKKEEKMKDEIKEAKKLIVQMKNGQNPSLERNGQYQYLFDLPIKEVFTICISNMEDNHFIKLLNQKEKLTFKIKLRYAIDKWLYIFNGTSKSIASFARILNMQRGTYSIGFSTTHTSITEIKRALDEAEFAQHTGIIDNKNRCVVYSPYSGSAYSYLSRAVNELFRQNKKSFNTQTFTSSLELVLSKEPSFELLYKIHGLYIEKYNQYCTTLTFPTHFQKKLFSIAEFCDNFGSLKDFNKYIESSIEDLTNYSSDKKNISDTKEIIQRCITYIDQNLTTDITLSKLADSFNFSAAKLSIAFSRYTGKKITHYIREKRIAHAKFLLTNSNQPVTQIAVLSGYDDYYYFARIFKESTGITASTYRKKYSS